MKKFLKHTGFFIFSILLLNHAFVWWYEIPQRRAIKEGVHKKLVKWNAIHSKPNTYDIIIIGSSRGYCAYDPNIINSITNKNSYNMCTGSQNVIESYYYLKEILKFQKPKYVVYETFLPSFSPSPDYFIVDSNASFMSFGSKRDMILHEFKGEAVLNLLFPILKYKYYLRRDLSNNMRPDEDITGGGAKWDKGYLYSEKIVTPGAIKNFSPIYSFDNTTISVDNIERYLGLIHQLCLKNNIQLICVRAPYPPSRLKISSADTVHEYFEKFYRTKNIPFYDFNYSSGAEYSDFDFTDYHHMNNSGAKKVSKELADTLTEIQVTKTSE
jgi:hypothetical protein